jgi:signal transduction histidine kinase
VDSALQQKATGSGLGLPLSRKLAEVLGGQLAVASTPGEGSVFSVTIPPVWTPPPRLSNAAVPAIEVQHV